MQTDTSALPSLSLVLPHIEHTPPQTGARALVCILLLGMPLPAQADRFGPPWTDKVIADQTTLFATPDRSQPIGPLPKDAIIVVLGQQGDMLQVPDGWVPASEAAETSDLWVAEVADQSVSIYAYPDSHSDVRRTAQQGDFAACRGRLARRR